MLSIDEQLQAAAEKAFPGKAGVVIALDPNTGYVLALSPAPASTRTYMTGRVSRQELQALSEDPVQAAALPATAGPLPTRLDVQDR